LVFKAEELGGEFAAGFFEIEFGVFEKWGFVFGEAVKAGDFSPRVEEVITNGAIFGGEVAEAGEGLEAFCHGKRKKRPACRQGRRPRNKLNERKGELPLPWGSSVFCRVFLTANLANLTNLIG